MLDVSIRIAYRWVHRLRKAWWFFRRPETHGALVAVWHDGRVLMIRQSYRREYLIPGGHLNPRESPREGALRELAEELDLRPDPARLRHAYRGVHRFERRRDVLDIFEVELDEPPRFAVDRREVIWAGLMTPAEVRAQRILPHLREYLAQREKERETAEGR